MARRPVPRRQGRPDPDEEGLPGPLVVHARRDRAVVLRDPAAHRHVPGAVLSAVDERSGLSRLVRQAGRHQDVAGVPVHDKHLVRYPRRPADEADPPLGRDHVLGRDHGAHAPDILHRRVPQAARDQLADRHRAVHARHDRGALRLLAPGRPAVRRRPADLRGCAPGHPDCGHVRRVLPVRRGVPWHRHRAADVHLARLPDPRPDPGPGRRPPVIMFHQKHSQMPMKGNTEKNVVGQPFFPYFLLKGQAWFFFIFGTLVVLATFAQINPVWLYGPDTPLAISSASQPDFYMGILEGSLRMMPAWEINFLGHTVSMSVLIPALLPLGIIFTGAALWPFFEQWATGDKSYHNVNDRPRNAPVRTGIGVAAILFYAVLLL